VNRGSSAYYIGTLSFVFVALGTIGTGHSIYMQISIQLTNIIGNGMGKLHFGIQFVFSQSDIVSQKRTSCELSDDSCFATISK